MATSRNGNQQARLFPEHNQEIDSAITDLPRQTKSEYVVLKVRRDTLLGMGKALWAMHMSAFISPHVKARFIELADLLCKAAEKEEACQLLETVSGFELVEASEEAVARMDGAAEAPPPSVPTTWYAEWSTCKGMKPHDQKRTPITGLSVWEFQQAVDRINRKLPPGALEWAARAKPGDKAKWYDAENDLLLKVEVDLWEG